VSIIVVTNFPDLEHPANDRVGYEATNSALKAQESRRRTLPLSTCTTTAASRHQWRQKLARMLASLRAKALLRSRHDVVHVGGLHITGCANHYYERRCCATRCCARQFCARQYYARRCCTHRYCARRYCARRYCARRCWFERLQRRPGNLRSYRNGCAWLRGKKRCVNDRKPPISYDIAETIVLREPKTLAILATYLVLVM
jgi:hypothetical protein